MPTKAKQGDTMSIARTCTVEGCVSTYKLAKGFCNYHHGVKWYKDRPLYGIWQAMKSRCYSKTHKRYSDWGGRGIKVCDRWLKSYDAFAEDMGERPKGYTLDRIDNNKGYSPDNCKWSSPKEQSNNKRALYKNNTSGHVCIQLKKPGVWRINHKENGRMVTHKSFYDKESAINAYHSIVGICKQCDK